MSSLSILNEAGIAVGCANPIYLTSELDQRPGAKITFEVLEADASYLRRLVGKTETFGIESSRGLFLAELTSLERCDSTTIALSLLGKPVMCGVLTVIEQINVNAPAKQA